MSYSQPLPPDNLLQELNILEAENPPADVRYAIGRIRAAIKSGRHNFSRDEAATVERYIASRQAQNRYGK